MAWWTLGHEDRALYRRILNQARPQAFRVALLFVLSLVATPILLLNPLPLKIVVDTVIGQEELPRFLRVVVPSVVAASPSGVLILAVALLALFALMAQAQKLASSMMYTAIGEKLTLEFRSRLFRHAQRLSLVYHDRRGTADSTYRVLWDAAAIRHVTLDGALPLIASSCTLAAMLYVVLRIDAQLALIALTVVPLLFVLIRVYRTQLRKRWRGVKQLEASALSIVQEVLASLRVVRAFGQEEREQERFVQEATDGLRARIGASLAGGGFTMLIALTTTAGTAAVLYVGVLHVQARLLSLGDLLVVMAYLAELYSPIKAMARNVGRLQAHLASAERAFALLDEGSDVPEREDARPLERAAGDVEFRHVSFSYDGGPVVLSDISFAVRPGMRVGIAGKTGAGKTTLMSLLSRFHDVREGQILLDGRDVKAYRLADLRRQFAIVLQEATLFSSSIAENIAYARPAASESEIIAAARNAEAHEFIMSTEQGYATRVGERGYQLSGGERQRLALARAFLRDAPILVLDEPTSSIDRATEAKILTAMNRLMDGRTTFLISHRLEVLTGCDLLLALDGGKLKAATRDVEAEIARLQDRVAGPTGNRAGEEA